MTFTWATGTPRERAEMVRREAYLTEPRRPLPWELCALFSLTPTGLVEILSGADWNSRFSSSPKPAAPVIRATMREGNPDRSD